MIRQLRIKNFKGWSDIGAIRMAPLIDKKFFAVSYAHPTKPDIF